MAMVTPIEGPDRILGDLPPRLAGTEAALANLFRSLDEVEGLLTGKPLADNIASQEDRPRPSALVENIHDRLSDVNNAIDRCLDTLHRIRGAIGHEVIQEVAARAERAQSLAPTTGALGSSMRRGEVAEQGFVPRSDRY